PPAAYGLGITLGAFFASRMSAGRIELGLIPLGAIGFSASSLLLGILQPGMAGTVGILILMGISSGLVIVPLHTLIQSRSKPDQRGAIIALGNFVDIGGMMAGSLFAAGISWLGVNIGEMLILSAFFVVLATIFAIRTLPAALVRFCFIVLTKTCYRFKVRGLENVPASGPFVIVSNHISCIDALFVMASLDRPVHFVMNEYYYNRWWLNPLVRLLETIPVSSSSNPKLLVEGMRRAGDYLDNGEIVCIFPEGQVTHTGVLLPFQRGVELIVRGRSCPIVPLYIDGVWGSIFSYKGGRFFKKWPEHRACSLTVTYGAPLPTATSSVALRQVIQELENKAWMAREDQYMPLPHAFIRNARQKPWVPALCDQATPKMSRIQVLTAAIVLGSLLKDSWKEEETIGLLLPPSIPGVICNLAATLSCRPVVNLNFTTGAGPLASAICQAKIRKIYTSRAFLEKIPVPIPEGVELIYLEDVRKKTTGLLKFKSLLKALFYDPEQIEKECGATREGTIEDILTIIFTSGSTGEPKGVVLSHFNIHANIDGVAQVVPGTPRCHRLVHALPFFHSFGYMMMWLGLGHKHALILHPNPLDFAAIGELAWKLQATLMMTTPTFLRGYMKRVLPGQFGTLKCVLTGAEKLPETLAQAFELQYGLRPIEGYGATECSPVIATSSLNVREPGICQLGTLPGTVGKPLPGILLRVVHPETFQELPLGEQGLLLVKGPNVMQGYLDKPELTREVIKDGWYVTGDIASLNQEGFVKITDRLSRFSKIGGEMVPHGRVEEYLHQVTHADQQLFAVTAIPDQQKGECLAVVHTVQPDKIAGILKQLSELGIPNLYIPKPDCFIQVESLPMLGSGKLDLKGVKAIALQKLTA
ncbi:MAG: AMP-binding protein, partial [Parachlamydia sp.]|nr:AMP-binding protein [Parachlamydia sp.]